MTTQTPLSPLELAVLGLLAQQPRSGYDLVRVFAETAMGGFSSSPGAVYPVLKRFHAAGAVEGRIESPHTLRPRQVFAITGLGTEVLKGCLRQPVTRDDVMRRAEVVLLRFVFAGEVLGRNEAVRILEQYAGEIEAYLIELKAQLAAFPAAAKPYGRYALQRGIDGYNSDARWARGVIEELKQKPKRRPGRRASGRSRMTRVGRKEGRKP